MIFVDVFHLTPLGSPSLLQVSINSEEVQGMSNRRRGQEARFQVNFLYWAGDVTSFPCAEREQALAHVIADETGAAYRRSDALAKRRLLMDQWATTVVCTRP